MHGENDLIRYGTLYYVPLQRCTIQIINQSTTERSKKNDEKVLSLNLKNVTLLSLISCSKKFNQNFLGSVDIKLS